MTSESKITKAKRGVEQALEKLRDLMSQFERFGDEPAIGSVIRFKKRFERSGKTYSYAALRTNVGWFTTGYGTGVSSIKLNRSGGMRWDDLVEFIGDSPAWISAEWREVPTLNPEVPANATSEGLNKIRAILVASSGRDITETAQEIATALRETNLFGQESGGEGSSAPRARSFLDDGYR